LPNMSRSAHPDRLDIIGAALVTSALVALVYGCTQAVSAGWNSAVVIGMLLTSAVLLVAFVLRQAFTRAPLLPLQIVLERNRGGSQLTVLLAIAGLFGAFLFITYYLQVVRGFSPLEAGLAFLPITVASQAGSWLIARQLMPRVPPRVLIAPGLLVAAAGMAGQAEVAAAALQELRRAQPNISLDWIAKEMPIGQDSEREHYLEGLRRAGLE